MAENRTSELQALVDADPTIQAALADYQRQFGTKSSLAHTLSAGAEEKRALAAINGLVQQRIPGWNKDDYFFKPGIGRVHKNEGFSPLMLAPLAPFAAFAAPALLGAGAKALASKGLLATMAKKYGQAALGKIPGVGPLLGGGGEGGDGAGMNASDILRTGAHGIGAATQAAGQERTNQEQFGLEANKENVAGQSAFETELLHRSMLEAQQRRDALKDVYRQSYTQGFRAGPETPAGSITPPSTNYSTALSGLEQQAMNRLRTAPQYGTDVMPKLSPYTPIDPRDVRGATGTKESFLSKLGKWAGPAMDVAGIGMQRRRTRRPMDEVPSTGGDYDI